MSAVDRLDQIEARANAADRAGLFESDYPTWAAWEAALYITTDVPDLVAALRAVLEVTADSLGEYPDDITALAVNRAITEALA